MSQLCWMVFKATFVPLLLFTRSSTTYELKPAVRTSNVTASGEDATIACILPSLQEKPTLILWYKDISAKPFYIFDARSTATRYSSSPASDATLSRRSNFTLHTNSFKGQVSVGYLIINAVKLDDSGNYTCRVDFSTSQTMMSLIQLEVHGFPPPRVSWLAGDKVLASSSEKAKLLMPVLRRHDQGKELTCIANNSQWTKPKRKTIILKLYLPPLHVEIEGLETPLLSGQESVLVCRSVGCHPPAKIHWSPSEILQEIRQQISIDENSTISRALVKLTSQDDGRLINCNASNPAVGHFSLSSSQILQVYYVPQVEIRLGKGLVPDDIKEGVDVYFDCLVKANPKPTSIAWLHDNKVVIQRPHQDSGILIQGNNLVIQAVSRHNRGKYQCQVTNAIGTTISDSVILSVMYVPECSRMHNVTVSISPSEEVQLICNVNSFPKEVKFSWAVNNSKGFYEVPNNSYRVHGTKSTFVYKPPLNARIHSRPAFPISENEKSGNFYGAVYCRAENRLGRQLSPCIFTLNPAGPPGELRNCTLVNQSSTSLRVNCIAGHDGGLTQHFIAKVLEVETKSLLANSSALVPEFQFDELSPVKDFLIMITAVNSKGASRPYVIEGFALKVAENKINDASSSNDSSLFRAAVACGFVAILSLLAIFTRITCRKRSSPSGVKSGQIGTPEEAPLSASGNPSYQDDAADEVVSEEHKWNAEKEAQEKASQDSRETRVYVAPSLVCSPTGPNVVLTQGLSMALGSSGGSCGNSLKGSSPTLHRPLTRQPLHSVDLPRMTSKSHKYYTLKINCTRQTNESFV